MHHSISVESDRNAWALLSDKCFLEKWSELYHACPWATAFQSPQFVCTWFGNYQKEFSPIIFLQSDDEHLTGMLILGRAVREHKLVVAGGYQAEYQVWLERPDAPGDFIAQALEAVTQVLPGYDLAFKYLPKEAPLQQIIRFGPQNRIEATVYQRSLLLINPETVQAILSNKRNKRSLKILNGLGKLVFRRIIDEDDLAAIFDEIIAFYDFRQGAVNDRFPFSSDASKKPFHLDLLRKHPDLLHVTVTTLDGKVVAAHIGVISKNQVHLGIIAHSPFYASYSPGKMHLLLLCKLLLDEGIPVLDLTPGNDPWKESFANAQDGVHKLTLYRSARAWQMGTLKSKGGRQIKKLSRSLGLSPEQAQNLFKRAKHFRPSEAYSLLTEFIWTRSELRVYRRTCESFETDSLSGRLNRDYLQDLIKYRPTGQSRRKQAFMLEAMNRIGRGEHFYTFVVADCLVHCGWLSEQEGECFRPEVQQSYTLPKGSVVFENFFTDPEYKGSDLFQEMVEQMLLDVSESKSDKPAFIFIPAQDQTARQIIEKIGFEYQGSTFLLRIFGLTRKWKQDVSVRAISNPELLGEIY